MRKSKLETYLFAVFACVAIFVGGFLVNHFRIFPYGSLAYATNSVANVFGEWETITGWRPAHFLQPARYDRAGVSVNTIREGEDDFILLTGFFSDSNEIRLIRRDGTIVARWPVKFHDLFRDVGHIPRPPKTNWNIDIHGAVILPDGSVVFNFEYAGLVKMDRCQNVVWTLPHATHHSVERAENGGFWVPGRRVNTHDSEPNFPPFTESFYEDLILKVSESGEIIYQLSVLDLLYENGLEGFLTANREMLVSGVDSGSEILHLNKITELDSRLADDFEMFAPGDLALSIRDMNLILVFDPNTRKIKWWQVGPWLRQHDPEFKPGGTMLVFNNNIYRNAFNNDRSMSDLSIPRVTNIIEVDPRSGASKIAFGGSQAQELLSVIRGKVESTPNGGLLITESEGGRAVESNQSGEIVWEYINRYDDNFVAEITEARRIGRDYFTVSNWACDKP